jgi:hypothetical protein
MEQTVLVPSEHMHHRSDARKDPRSESMSTACRSRLVFFAVKKKGVDLPDEEAAASAGEHVVHLCGGVRAVRRRAGHAWPACTRPK